MKFEKEFGDEKHQRKVLLRGLNESIDSKECLCELLLKFEKQNGTIESYTLAKLKCDKIFDQINAENSKKQEEFHKKQNKKPVQNTNNEKQQQQPQKKQQSKQREVQDKKINNLKRKVS